MPVNATPAPASSRDVHDEHEAQSLDVDAQVTRRTLTQGQQVQLRRVVHRDAHAHDHERRDREHRIPGRACQAAQVPEGDGAQCVVAGDERQHPDDRAREGGDRDAHQDQGDHLGAAARARQAVHDERGQEAADERGDGHGPAAQRGDAEHDDRERPDGRSRRDADDARLRERIAEHALHQRAGAAEGGADEDGQHDPREAHQPQRVVAARRAWASAGQSMPSRWRIEPSTWSTGTCSWPMPAATRHATMSAMPSPTMVREPRLVTPG